MHIKLRTIPIFLICKLPFQVDRFSARDQLGAYVHGKLTVRRRRQQRVAFLPANKGLFLERDQNTYLNL